MVPHVLGAIDRWVVLKMGDHWSWIVILLLYLQLWWLKQLDV